MAVDSYQLAVIGYQFIERHFEKASADVAICSGIVKRVSSSGGI